MLPLILLPMVILAGILQPVHEMSRPMRWLAQAMPSRWAFEGLLLLEVENRPNWTPPAPPALPGIPTAATAGEQPRKQDMAERYFPEDERLGTCAGGIVLAAMLALLMGAVHVILRSRDVH